MLEHRGRREPFAGVYSFVHADGGPQWVSGACISAHFDYLTGLVFSVMVPTLQSITLEGILLGHLSCISKLRLKLAISCYQWM